MSTLNGRTYFGNNEDSAFDQTNVWFIALSSKPDSGGTLDEINRKRTEGRISRRIPEFIEYTKPTKGGILTSR
jgi:hypothetical protein